MYSRSTLHIVGKLSLVWDTVGTLHLGRDMVSEGRVLENRAFFERREFTVNELEESGETLQVGRRVNLRA